MGLDRSHRWAGVLVTALTSAAVAGEHGRDDEGRHRGEEINVQVGVRPYYLVDKLADGPLKSRLKQCRNIEFHKTAFSIGHRGGATLQFPEHTREDHLAGARMGAGIQECDVTFTKDGELVCRHAQN
ncbi:MAG TPA: glycerophosphodiester phosphodiesterase family protein, partial [Myxococcaceae bacterium]|nr:glycerophosphodiester phosphodiesterase family protein [Myxococcaceae bacterium]